jgi:hypothetical protein
MKYDSFDDKYFPKRLVFSGDIQSFVVGLHQEFNTFPSQKEILESQQQFLKMLQLKSIRKLVFLWQ